MTQIIFPDSQKIFEWLLRIESNMKTTKDDKGSNNQSFQIFIII